MVRSFKNRNEKMRQQRLARMEKALKQNKEELRQLYKQLESSDKIISNISEVSELSQKSDEEKTVYNTIDYFKFENYFRGNEEDIKNRLRVYLPYYVGCRNVIDLGCGRGEFLALLSENGIMAKGVDICDSYVDYGKKRGLNIEKCDAIEYLKRCNTKIDGIFGAQLVEHLQLEQIIELFKVAYEKLNKDGYLILETPNPTSLAIFTQSFYVDPSHERPIHPLTLKFIAESVGFKDVQIYFVEGSGLNESVPQLQGDGIDNLEEFNKNMRRIGDYLYGAQDYAIIVKR